MSNTTHRATRTRKLYNARTGHTTIVLIVSMPLQSLPNCQTTRPNGTRGRTVARPHFTSDAADRQPTTDGSHAEEQRLGRQRSGPLPLMPAGPRSAARNQRPAIPATWEQPVLESHRQTHVLRDRMSSGGDDPVETTGIEPATSAVQGRRSPN